MRLQKIIRFKNSHVTEKYIRIFNGIFSLTPKEIEMLAKFIDVYKKAKEHGLADTPFDTNIKKQVAKELEMKDFNMLNPYIQSLKNKNAIIRMEKGYAVHPFLMPHDGEKEIVFKLL